MSSSRKVRISNSFIPPSPPAVATRCPDGAHLHVLTVDLCECLELLAYSIRDETTGIAYNVLNSLPVLGSQNLTNISLDPETNKPFVGCQSTHLTSHPWPTVSASIPTVHHEK